VESEPGRRWTLDRARSVAEFTVGFWLGTFSGRVERFDGTYAVGPAGARLDLTLDATSVDSDAPWLDERLGELLGGQTQVRFASTRIVDAGDGKIRVTGVADAAGKSREVSFLATVRHIGDEVELESKTSVERPRATVHVKARFAPSR
jgi:polyisoprenoid-binding protein YceI